MPTRPSPPAYRLHKARNCAVVTVHGKNHYLGPYGSAASHEKYARLIAEWRQNSQPKSDDLLVVGHPDISINEMLLAYWRFAANYYAKDGKPTKELACVRDAILPLRELYGLSPVREFGPKALKAVRQHMIGKGLARSLINHRVSRIKRVFKWAVAEELVPPSIFHGLQAVSGLRFGRSEARETEPVRPVADGAVEAVLRYLTPTIAAMVRLQRLTGMRPGEVCIMRACDIDMTEDVWLYEPAGQPRPQTSSDFSMRSSLRAGPERSSIRCRAWPTPCV
jgi:integrase